MKILFMFVVIALLSSACSKKLDTNEAENLLTKHFGLATDQDSTIEKVVQDGFRISFNSSHVLSFSRNDEYTCVVSSKGEDASVISLHFINWLVRNEYFKPTEENFTRQYYENTLFYGQLTDNGIKDLTDPPYMVGSQENGFTRWTILFTKEAKPKVKGIRSLGNDRYEVLYNKGVELVNKPYAKFLGQFINLPKVEDQKIFITKYGDAFKVEEE